MRSKWLGALLSAVVVGMVMPAAALAAKPAATTGAVSKVTFSSVHLKGSVDPNKQATTYYFQYGTTIALGTQTAPFAAGNGDKAVRAAASTHGPRAGHEVLLPGRRPQQLGHGARQAAFVHDQKQPLGVSLVATPNPVPPSTRRRTVKGTLSGTGNAGRKVVLQSSAWPYTLRLPERVQRAGHQRDRQLRVPAAAGAVTQTPSSAS